MRRKPEGYDDMTHEELLALLSDRDWEHTSYHKLRPTLREVIKLHKPVTAHDGLVVCKANCEGEYPCETIQTIMGEVK